MGYALIGRLVVWGAKRYMRQRYGPQLVPRPALAGVVAVAVVVMAVRSARRGG